MRIASSFFTPIYFEEPCVQNFIFQDANQLNNCRMLWQQFEHNHEMLGQDFIRLDNGFDTVKAKDYHILQLHGGDLNLLDEKQWQQKVFQKIIEKIEVDFIPMYEKIKETIEVNLDGLVVNVDDFQIHVNYEEFQLTQLQKYIKWDIKEMEEPLTNFSRLKFILQVWTSLTNGKPSIIIYHFPENDIDIQKIELWAQMLKNTKSTIICITKSKEWLMQFPVEHVHFIKKSRERFDLTAFLTELDLLGEVENDSLSKNQLAISLAYEELIVQNPLLCKKLRQFIQSSHF